MNASGALAAGFDAAEVERSAAYHRPLYLLLVHDLFFGFGVLSVLAFSGVGDRWYSAVAGLRWWAAAPAFAVLVDATLFSARFPVSFWRGFVRERRWGFSTQSLRGWVTDRAKGLVVGSTLSAVVALGLVGLARAWPGWWPLPAAAAAATGVVLLSFVAPVVLEPLFNRFRPLDDSELASRLRTLAARAGVPVRDVLVADASRRTRKVNAYVSGFGRTRRVVVYDTLLERADERQLALVVAHELGHRRDRHVLKGTLLGAAGAVGATMAVWSALGDSAAEPRKLPVAFLVGLGLEVVAGGPGAWLSRRWERAADRCSLELTRDREAFETAHRELARANLSDLAPPRLAYLFLFSHPTPPERITAARSATV